MNKHLNKREKISRMGAIVRISETPANFQPALTVVSSSAAPASCKELPVDQKELGKRTSVPIYFDGALQPLLIPNSSSEELLANKFHDINEQDYDQCLLSAIGAKMNFVALDVETANPDYSSICQVGVALFENGVVKKTWSTLINPEDYFHPVNVSIHGITENDVATSPIFHQVLPALIDEFIENAVVVHHTPFDKVAICRASTKYGLGSPQIAWLDSAKIVRRAWPEFAYSGYGLANVCATFGIEYAAHDALEDAIAAGKVVIAAIEATGIPLSDWVERCLRPITTPAMINLKGNPSGSLYGEHLVFTGRMSRPRGQMAKIASATGCNVSDSVNINTTILVLGTQDIRKLAGKKRSAKHRKAIALINEGVNIRIISEADLVAMGDAG